MTGIDVTQIDPALRISEIAWAELPYRRPRIAGKNARLDTHGWGGKVPLARVRAGDAEGFGWCTLTRQQADSLVGLPLRALFCEDGMLKRPYRGLEFALLDLLGSLLHQPVYRLVGKTDEARSGNVFTVPVYDTTIYFDELHLAEDKAAVEFILAEVQEGLDRGHRHFKMKIGRPGMWMGVTEGMGRDVDIVLGVRQLTGPDAKLMVDANNGYNLNLTKQFLEATASAGLHWLEEAFHEDNMLYAELRRWMAEQKIATLIADGEGYACEAIVDWAKQGLIDVLQYDLRGYGFFSWMELCRELESFPTLCAPHNYGGFYGNYAQAHFSAITPKFAFAEFDVADAEGVDTSAYSIRDGRLVVPDLDGFGLSLHRDVFETHAAQGGWSVAAL